MRREDDVRASLVAVFRQHGAVGPGEEALAAHLDGILGEPRQILTVLRAGIITDREAACAVAGRVHTWLQSHGDATLDGRDDEPLLREVEAVLVAYRDSTR